MGRKPKCSSCDEYRWGVCFGDNQICKDYVKYKPAKRHPDPVIVAYRKVEKKIEAIAHRHEHGHPMAYQLGILKGLRMALGYAPKSMLSDNAKEFVEVDKAAVREYKGGY